MQIEHIALWVNDIDAICKFYAEFFDARIGSLYENVAKGFSSRFVSFDSGTRIEVMRTTTLNPVPHEAGVQRMGLAHFAVTLGSEAAVNQQVERMKASNVKVVDGPRRTGDGYYEAVILDPEGNRIELMA